MRANTDISGPAIKQHPTQDFYYSDLQRKHEVAWSYLLIWGKIEITTICQLVLQRWILAKQPYVVKGSAWTCFFFNNICKINNSLPFVARKQPRKYQELLSACIGKNKYFRGVGWPESLSRCGRALWKRNAEFFDASEVPASCAAESRCADGNRRQQSAEHATRT